MPKNSAAAHFFGVFVGNGFPAAKRGIFFVGFPTDAAKY